VRQLLFQFLLGPPPGQETAESRRKVDLYEQWQPLNASGCTCHAWPVATLSLAAGGDPCPSPWLTDTLTVTLSLSIVI
jgi:hypothetical protein